MKLVRVLGFIMMLAGWITASVLGIYIYVVSILGANAGSGIFAAIVTAILPPFAQAYWFFVNWSETGSITSPYALTCLIWLAAVVAIFVGRIIMPDD